MNIGEVIKSRRQRRNITQAERAELLHVTPQAVSRWEMEISYPDVAMIPDISKALWVTADELLGIVPVNEAGESKDDLSLILNQSQADSVFDYVPVPVSGESKKVLVTDDSDFMRMMVENILTKEGHTVLRAKDGQECLDMLQKEAVDVCVLDICMPGMHGIDVLRRIKEEHPEIKVVMLSAMSQESNVKQALELGADSFVVKPFQENILRERIG